MADDTTIIVPTLRVRTAAVEAVALKDALGLSQTLGPVPLTFPIRWLAAAEVRNAVSRIPGVRHERLLHQSQSFIYRQPLEAECDYLLNAKIQSFGRGSGLDRITIAAEIERPAGCSVATTETVLRVGDGPLSFAGERRLNPMHDGLVPALPIGPIGPVQTRRYAAAALDDNPLHFDAAAAQALGLSAPIVPGMLVAGQFEQALCAWRTDFRVSRWYAVFLQPLSFEVPAILEMRAADVRREASSERWVLRLGVRARSGEPVAIGEIAGTLG